MNKTERIYLYLSTFLITFSLLVMFSCNPAFSFEPERPNYTLNGYLRTWVSLNLDDPPEVSGGRYDISMLRGSLLLDFEGWLENVMFKAVGRFDGEIRTGYLKRLEDSIEERNDFFSSVLGKKIQGPGHDIMRQYNNSELREAYIELPFSDFLRFRLGKQQVAWGQPGFFRAFDMVHGYDYRWRAFLELEKEELRKPLFMANTMIQVHKLNGMLQILFRPGWDKNDAVGDRYSVEGGRWQAQPARGMDYLSLLKYDYTHPDGDVNDPTYGIRWTGRLNSLEYSFAYLKTCNDKFVINSRFNPCRKMPKGELGDFIHPEVDHIGMTLNKYFKVIDSVLGAEVVYTFDKPFNYGSNYTPNIPTLLGPIPLNLPGFEGIIKKDVITAILRIDKNLNTSELLGTSGPAFFTLQIYDHWIQNFSRSDDIIHTATWGARIHEHSVMVGALVLLNFMNKSVNPMLAGCFDATYGGGVLIPSVDFIMGDNWRLKIEADLFFSNGEKRVTNPIQQDIETNTNFFGYFANNSQLMLRLTRQF